MEKLAIFIDTNYFCKRQGDKYLPIPKVMFQVCDYLLRNDNVVFLMTSIFKSEIIDKIDKLASFDDISNTFFNYINFAKDDEDDEISKKINEYREMYKKTIDEFITKCQFIDIELSTTNIEYCCDRYYKKLPPFDKKSNSWKDCLNLIYLKKWAELNKDEYKIWFVSRDGDFDKIKKDEFKNIEFVNKLSSIEALHERIDAYLKRNNLHYAILDCLFRQEEEISKEIECHFEQKNPFISDIEVSIHSIKIIEVKKEQYQDELNGEIEFEVYCNIYGIDRERASYDKEDGIYYNTDELNADYLVKINCSFNSGISNYEEMQLDIHTLKCDVFY